MSVTLTVLPVNPVYAEPIPAEVARICRDAGVTAQIAAGAAQKLPALAPLAEALVA